MEVELLKSRKSQREKNAVANVIPTYEVEAMKFLNFLSCCRSAGDDIESDPLEDLRVALSAILSIYIDASYASIISKEGILLATLSTEEALGIDMTANIAALKTAASHFSNVLKLKAATHMIICGENQIFSCYALYNGYMLVFFSNRGNMKSNFTMGDRYSNEELSQILGEINEILMEMRKRPV